MRTNLTSLFTDIADAIRSKKGTSAQISPQDFASEISSISGGGNSDSVPTIPIIGDGKTYLYIKIATKGRMTVPLYFSQTVENGVTIDWGDGSVTQTLSGTGNINTSHTYTEIGEYTISLNPISECTLKLGHSSSNYSVMGGTDNNRVYCNMLQAVEIGRHDACIGHYAFSNCSLLSSIVIPDGITEIYAHAFEYCTNLTSVNIPNGVTDIGQYAFSNCYSLSNIVIPEGVTTINNYAFSNCYSLSNIVIPDSITSILSYAFSNCYSLSNIVIPEGVTTIGEEAFSSCYSLSNIVIPEGITKINKYVFQYCNSLSNVVIPEGVTTIDKYAFKYCTSLSNIVIPEGVTTIGEEAFSSCYSLSNVVIPSSITNIYNKAFRYCYGVAFYDFSQCTSVPTLGGTDVFYGINSDCKIVVPDDLYYDWINATNWTNYASNIIKKFDCILQTECTSLTITAEDVHGNAKTTKIHYTAIVNGKDILNNTDVVNVEITGELISDEFPQNTSYTDTIEREVSYTYMGVTATTTFTHGVWIDSTFYIDLNDGQWELSTTIPNPDETLYDGVYQSVKSKGVNNGCDTMYIDIVGYDTFDMYIRSYAESKYDYVMVSQPDKNITSSTSYSDTTLVKAHTRDKQSAITTIDGYTHVEFTGLEQSNHRITVVYRKDNSSNNNDDRGYVLIPKN